MLTMLWLLLVPAMATRPDPAPHPGDADCITSRWPLDSTIQVEICHLPSPFNSSHEDYGATPAPSGHNVYFVSDRDGGKGGHDMWAARFDGVPVAGPAFDLQPPVNSSDNEGGMAFSADNSHFYLSACNRAGGTGDCDIWAGVLRHDSLITWEPAPRINTRFWESQPSISPDGTELYFVTNRSSGENDVIDIMSAKMQDDGSFASPKKVSAVNSSYRDESPCVTMNGRVLLFTSDRSGGEGGFDIYYSLRGDDGSWGTPQNLGPAFNTSKDERTVSASADGREIFIASSRTDLGGLGGLDLYIARLTAPGK